MEIPVLGKFQEALSYAAEVHNGQLRKGTSIPYISHLLAVCALVFENGGTEEEAIAALLHDALEDHPDKVTREYLCEHFGPRVAELVEGCSDTPPDYRGGPKPPWRGRKERYIQHIREGSTSIRVSLADKLHNLRTILSDYGQLGDRVWDRFNAGKADQLWYYRALVDAFREAGAPGRMLQEFDRMVAEIEHAARGA